MRSAVAFMVAAFVFAGLPQLGSAEQGEADRASPAEVGRIESITVTARKKEETLQETPVSLTVISGDDFERQTIEDFYDMQYMAPNLNIGQSPATGSTVQLGMRGINTGGFTSTEDQSVSVYLDGVHNSRVVGLLADMMDMERVEVLRGPQLAFGKNTTGGALALHSRKPDGTFNGYVSAGVGSFDRYETRGAVGFPILGETLSGRIAWLGRTRDGVTHSNATGNDFDERKVMGFRGSLLWTPRDDLEFLFTADRRKSRNGATNARLRSINPEGSLIPVISLLTDLTTPTGFGFGIPNAGLVQSTFESLYKTGKNASSQDGDKPNTHQGLTFGDRQDDDIWGFALNSTFDINENLTLKSITGHRRMKATRSSDQDGVPDNDLFTGGAVDWFWSGDEYDFASLQQEFQLSGTALDNRLDFIAGFYVYWERGQNDAYQAVVPDTISLNPLDPRPTIAPLAALNLNQRQVRKAKNWNYSPWLMLDYHFTDRTTLTGGVRFTVERRQAEYRNRVTATGALARTFMFPAGTPANPVIPNGDLYFNDCTLGVRPNGQIGKCAPTEQGRFTDNAQRFTLWSWSTKLTHRWNDDLMSYASATLGRRSGIWPARPVSQDELVVTKPEKAMQYEIGTKSQWWDDRLRVNVSAYHTNFSDIITGSIEDRGGVTASISQNAGRAYIQGVEVETLVLPTPALTLQGSFGWTNYRWVQNTTRDAFGNLVDRSGITTGAIPDLTYWLSARYAFPTFFNELDWLAGSLTAQADFYWQSRTDSFDRTVSRATGLQCTSATPCNDPVVKKGFTETNNYGVLNARISYAFENRPIELAFWGRNLTDRAYETAWIDFPFGSVVSYSGTRREVGVELTYRFGEGT